MVDVTKMRQDAQAYRAFRGGEYYVVQECPIAQWGGREYAVVSTPKLVEGRQRIDVIDLTSFDEIEFEGSRAARFARTWPEQSPRERETVLLITPDEGHCCLLTEDGSTRWVWSAVLTVRMTPGTNADREKTQEEMMDELEQDVDAGGGLR